MQTIPVTNPANIPQLQTLSTSTTFWHDRILSFFVVIYIFIKNSNLTFGRIFHSQIWFLCVFDSKSRPVIQVVDDIVFRKPVEIGSLLFFCSQVRERESCWHNVNLYVSKKQEYICIM